jgi:membrane protein YqaA with SNARE-associated domain
LRDNLRYVVGGATIGALLGAVAGWLLGRGAAKSVAVTRDGREIESAIDTGQLLRLGVAVVAVVRLLLELG